MSKDDVSAACLAADADADADAVESVCETVSKGFASVKTEEILFFGSDKVMAEGREELGNEELSGMGDVDTAVDDADVDAVEDDDDDDDDEDNVEVEMEKSSTVRT